MKTAVIIAAGGTGKRMGLNYPKQFALVYNKPVLFYTLAAFSRFDSDMRIILVLPSAYIDEWKKMVSDYAIDISHEIVEGGETRYHSVKNGLSFLGNCDIVAIHDAVRPLITISWLQHLFQTAKEHGTAIPVLPMVDTIREITTSYQRVLDRSKIFAVQTPQVFRYDWIKQAYMQPFDEQITDDSMLVEQAGYKLSFVSGLKYNIKLTTPEDLFICKHLIAHQIHNYV